MLPPPNSPWAALDGDFGLELMGHMSRIAEIPDKEYLFRYYIHDPWYVNSPWYDRYNGQPHDIYLPMAVARIDADGKVQPPTNLNLLTVDNSFGNLPEACVYEPLPHLMKAEKEAPDTPSPIVWVYPFDEYSDCDSGQKAMEMFFGDWFIRNAINAGVPVSTVVSTENFTAHNKSIYSSSVIVSAVPEAGSRYENEIIKYSQSGGKVIFIGNTKRASRRFTDFIGVAQADEVSGELEVTVDGKYAGIVKHNPVLSGGGINTEAADGRGFAFAGNKVIGAKGDGFVWLRGTNSCDYRKDNKLLIPHDENKYFRAEKLMIDALKHFGYCFEYDTEPGARNPIIMIHRHNGAFIFSSYCADTTVSETIKLPFGAPVLDGYETKLKDGKATYHFPKAERRECRVFVEQESGTVGCREIPPGSAEYRRRIEINGLKNATVRFAAEAYCRKNVKAVLNSNVWYIGGDSFESEYVTINGVTFYEARNITGKIVFSMPFTHFPPK